MIAICNNIEVHSEEEINRKKKRSGMANKFVQKFKNVDQHRILFYFVRFYVNFILNLDDRH